MRELTDEELALRLSDAREAFLNLRFQHAQGALEQTDQLGARRREIARLLTVARERQDESE
ncbi:MAG: 50S ribosomal protein L29 [Miltoncostaeaceae bacterium]